MSLASALAGMTARLRAVVTARMVYAIMLIRLQRIQEFQQVTWPWSSPDSDFAAWKFSSMV